MTRAIGTLAAGLCFVWKGYYWPERFSYAWTPYGTFLIVGSWFTDFVIYPVVFAYVKDQEVKGQPLENPAYTNGSANHKPYLKAS